MNYSSRECHVVRFLTVGSSSTGRHQLSVCSRRYMKSSSASALVGKPRGILRTEKVRFFFSALESCECFIERTQRALSCCGGVPSLSKEHSLAFIVHSLCLLSLTRGQRDIQGPRMNYSFTSTRHLSTDVITLEVNHLSSDLVCLIFSLLVIQLHL